MFMRQLYAVFQLLIVIFAFIQVLILYSFFVEPGSTGGLGVSTWRTLQAGLDRVSLELFQKYLLMQMFAICFVCMICSVIAIFLCRVVLSLGVVHVRLRTSFHVTEVHRARAAATAAGEYQPMGNLTGERPHSD